MPIQFSPISRNIISPQKWQSRETKQPETFARTCSSSTSRSLIGSGLTDPFDFKLLNASRLRVNALFVAARVDHIFDAWNGE